MLRRLFTWAALYTVAWAMMAATGGALGTIIACLWEVWTEGSHNVSGIMVVGVQVSIWWLKRFYAFARGDVKWLEKRESRELGG